MNICLLFGYFPSIIEEKIFNDTKSFLQQSANVLQKKYIEGLSYHYDKITIINAPFVGYFPLRYKSIMVPECCQKIIYNNATVDTISFSFNTLPFLCHNERYYKSKKTLKQWLELHKQEDNIVIVYSVHRPFIKACIELKKMYGFKVIAIVPDLPQYMNANPNLVNRIHQFIYKLFENEHSYTQYFNDIDGFIYLTSQMDRKITELSKPFIVIEGIVSDNNNLFSTNLAHEKYILYTGTMARKYGIMNLIESFKHITHSDYWLYLCGSGDCVEEIKTLESKYKIRYWGELSHQKVVELQQKASLLINPRLNDGEYVKYSFPSKIMEYFVSGTPTAMHKLSGIPDEYYEYCYIFDSDNPYEIAKRIDEILDISEQERLKKGEQAKEFVLKEKNAKAQCKKVQCLINSLFYTR